MSGFVDIDQWYSDFCNVAYRENHPTRLQIIRLFQRLWELRHTDAVQAARLCDQVISLAQSLPDAPCMLLYARYWRVELYAEYLADMEAALDYAVQNVTLSTGEAYRDCPGRAKVYWSLIKTYAYIDAVGYADEVLEMIAYASTELPLDWHTHLQLMGMHARIHLSLENLERAREIALQYLATDNLPGLRLYSAHGYMMDIELDAGNLPAAIVHAEQAIEAARRIGHQAGIALSTLELAALQQHIGDPPNADRNFRTGL
ncbi:MAG: hypothetical protein AAF125_02885, partial [Chloroflexota bacterium]